MYILQCQWKYTVLMSKVVKEQNCLTLKKTIDYSAANTSLPTQCLHYNSVNFNNDYYILLINCKQNYQ